MKWMQIASGEMATAYISINICVMRDLVLTIKTHINQICCLACVILTVHKIFFLILRCHWDLVTQLD